MLGIGSQKPTALLLIWLMCFLTKAFATGLSRHCGQGSGPHLFFIYTAFTTLIKERKKADRDNRRLVLKKLFFCVGEYAEYEFDQQG